MVSHAVGPSSKLNNRCLWVSIMLNQLCQLDWVRITLETQLWVCLWGCLQGPILTVDNTIPWAFISSTSQSARFSLKCIHLPWSTSAPTGAVGLCVPGVYVKIPSLTQCTSVRVAASCYHAWLWYSVPLRAKSRHSLKFLLVKCFITEMRKVTNCWL